MKRHQKEEAAAAAAAEGGRPTTNPFDSESEGDFTADDTFEPMPPSPQANAREQRQCVGGCITPRSFHAHARLRAHTTKQRTHARTHTHMRTHTHTHARTHARTRMHTRTRTRTHTHTHTDRETHARTPTTAHACSIPVHDMQNSLDCSVSRRSAGTDNRSARNAHQHVAHARKFRSLQRPAAAAGRQAGRHGRQAGTARQRRTGTNDVSYVSADDTTRHDKHALQRVNLNR